MAEPEWDEEMRDLVLSLDACERDELCPRCGRPRSVCQDPERQFDWVAMPPVRCHAYTAWLAAQDGVNESTNPHAGALMWSVALREEVADG